jgi:hypothetical protein
MTTPVNTQTEGSNELLERGKLALRVLQYREQAARFMAEATQLEAAMLIAESGDTAALQRWLDTNQFAVNRLEKDATKSSASFSINTVQDAKALVSEDEDRNDAPSSSTDSCGACPETPRLGPALQSDSQESPWERMSQGAAERLRMKAESSNAIAASCSSGTDQATLNLIEKDSVRETLQEPQLISLTDIEVERQPIKRSALLFAAHVWVSLGLHVGLVVALSIVVISATEKQELLSIVSSPVEAENVLMETPMEMISEMETSSIEPMNPAPSPDISELSQELTLPAVAIESGTQPGETASPSSSVAQSSSNSMQGMAGSKMVSGAEFFGVKATGNTFVYIIDCSPSMKKDNALQAAKAEVFRSFASMKPKQRFYVSFFGKEIDPLVLHGTEAEKYPIYATKENVVQTQEWMNRVAIQKEGWPPNDALEQAIAMQPDGIFMLFDGDTKVDVAKFLRQVNRTDDILSEGSPKVPIHVIHFFQEDFRKQMMTVAQENGGTYRFIPRPERPTTNKR